MVLVAGIEKKRPAVTSKKLIPGFRRDSYPFVQGPSTRSHQYSEHAHLAGEIFVWFFGSSHESLSTVKFLYFSRDWFHLFFRLLIEPKAAGPLSLYNFCKMIISETVTEQVWAILCPQNVVFLPDVVSELV